MADNYTTIKQTKKGLRAAQSSIISVKTALEGRMSAAEDAINNFSGYDDTSISGRVSAVEGLLDGHTVGKDVPADAVFTDTVYDDTSVTGRLTAAEEAIDTLEASGYDDTALTGRISAVEGLVDGHSLGKDVPADAVFTDTVYDDTSIAGRVSANETAIAALQAGTYDDTAITNRVSAVEGLLDGHSVGKDVPADAVFTDTVYDDTSISGRVTAAEAAIETLEANGYDDTALAARVTANENAITTLNGSGAGSVSKAVGDAIDAIVDGAPGTFDTLKEFADWIEDDQTGAAAMAADLANKVNKIEGKSLSTNDYTDEDKSKLAGLSNYDDTALAGRVSANESAIAALQVSGYDDTALSGRVTTVEGLLDGHSVGKNVPADAVFTDTVYDDTALAARVSANETAIAGIQEYDDTALAGRVSTVEGLIGGHSVGKDVPSDAVFTDTVYDDTTITAALADKADSADLAAVATSGSYNDLTDLPTGSGGGAIPAYIVGTNEMGVDWLSETDGGEALTPVDLQEYVILTSGSWLRKHVMWMADDKVYRLTGKVLVTEDKQRSIYLEDKTVSSGMDESFNTAYGDQSGRVLASGTVNGDITSVSFSVNLGQYYTDLRQVGIYIDDELVKTIENTVLTYDGETKPMSGTVTLGERSGKKKWAVKIIIMKLSTQAAAGGASGRSYINNGSVTVNYGEYFYDYETDDVIDITEEEISQIWAETGGVPVMEDTIYSTAEAKCGTWIDGKPIYKKTVNTGALPNTSIKEVLHGIDNIAYIVAINGTAFRSSDGRAFNLPHAVTNSLTNAIQLTANTTKIFIETGSDRSGVNMSYVTLYYTKTTD